MLGVMQRDPTDRYFPFAQASRLYDVLDNSHVADQARPHCDIFNVNARGGVQQNSPSQNISIKY